MLVIMRYSVCNREILVAAPLPLTLDARCAVREHEALTYAALAAKQKMLSRGSTQRRVSVEIMKHEG